MNAENSAASESFELGRRFDVHELGRGVEKRAFQPLGEPDTALTHMQKIPFLSVVSPRCCLNVASTHARVGFCD